MEGISGKGGPSGPGMDDVFSQMFAGGMRFGFDFGGASGGSGFRRRTKGDDTVIPHEVTLEDLYNGKSVKMMMEKEIPCSVCKGYDSIL